MAVRAEVGSANVTKPKPEEMPVSRSRCTWRGCAGVYYWVIAVVGVLAMHLQANGVIGMS